MLGHTPGPWITDTSHRQDREGVTIWAESNIIADVVPDHHNQEEANARLIASAPGLLTALINLTHALGDDHELCLWCEDLSWEQRDDMPHHVDCVAGKARAAIAKAEGRA